MAYTVTEEARSEMLSPAGVQATRMFTVSPCAARGEAYADLLGGITFAGGRLVRVPPLCDPGYLPARVSEIDTELIDEDTLDGDLYENSYNSPPTARPVPQLGLPDRQGGGRPVVAELLRRSSPPRFSGRKSAPADFRK